MEQTSFALESMKDSVSQVKAMKAANTELKKAFKSKELNIGSIDKLHDDMADMMVRVLHKQLFFAFIPFGQINRRFSKLPKWYLFDARLHTYALLMILDVNLRNKHLDC